MTDGSYIQVCSEIYPGKVSWVDGDHSAITTSTPGYWISKWNKYPLIEHYKDDTPFGNTYAYYASTKISGSTSNLCSGTRTFSVKDISGATYTWTYSSTLTATTATNTNEITVQRNGSSNGAAWVKVQISTPCSAISADNRVDFIVGVPPYTYEIVPSPISSYTDCYKLNKTYSFTVQPTGQDPHYPEGSYQWYCTGSDMPSTTKTASLKFTSAGNYTLTVRPYNACGVGPVSVYSETLHASSSCAAGYYLVSPNPVSSNLKIETVMRGSENILPATNKKIAGIDRIEVVDKMGNVVLRNSYSRSTQKINVNVSSLSPDIYIVRIYNSNISEEHKIVVRH